MISSWWFRLYTRTFLLRLGQLGLVALGLDLVLTYADSLINRLAFLLPLVALLTKFTPGSFRENIEFHKLSVPFGDLRRAFLTDVFLTGLATLGVLYLEMGASHLLGGFFSTPAAKPFRDLTGAMIFYYTIAAFVGICWVCFIAVDKKYVFYGLKHRTFWQKVFFLAPVWFVSLVQMAGALIAGFQVEVAYTFLLGSLFFGSALFFLKAIFHRGPTHATTLNWFKHYGIGLAVFALIFGFSAFIGRDAVLDPEADADRKLTSFQFMGPFNPDLDRRTFTMIEPLLHPYELKDLYAHLAFNPSDLGPGYFLDNTRDHARLLVMLQYGHPSEAFLLDLYEHLSAHQTYWEKVPAAPQIRYHAFNHWPHDRKLPEKFLTERKKAEDFAEIRKLRRLPAAR